MKNIYKYEEVKVPSILQERKKKRLEKSQKNINIILCDIFFVFSFNHFVTTDI